LGEKKKKGKEKRGKILNKGKKGERKEKIGSKKSNKCNMAEDKGKKGAIGVEK
jgi:hypothetical protein